MLRMIPNGLLMQSFKFLSFYAIDIQILLKV